MKTILALPVAALLFMSATCISATVRYHDHALTIVAKQEPLDSVLKSLGKEMRIYVTIPTGLNPVVNCNIQHQPIKQAFKNLLGDLGYSLMWAKGGERLLGLTLFAGGSEAAVAAVSDSSTHKQSAAQAAPSPISRNNEQGAEQLVAPDDPDTSLADHGTPIAEHEGEMATEREESEARMIEEKEAQEARLSEAIERHDAETAAYLESQGIKLPQ